MKAMILQMLWAGYYVGSILTMMGEFASMNTLGFSLDIVLTRSTDLLHINATSQS